MAVIVDASFAAAWFLPDEDSQAATVLARRIVEKPGAVPTSSITKCATSWFWRFGAADYRKTPCSFKSARLKIIRLARLGGGDDLRVARDSRSNTA